MGNIFLNTDYLFMNDKNISNKISSNSNSNEYEVKIVLRCVELFKKYAIFD